MTETGGLLPTAAALRAYLRTAGWAEKPPDVAGTVWVKGSTRLAVPCDDEPFFLKGAIERAAHAEGRTPRELTAVIIEGTAARKAMLLPDEGGRRQVPLSQADRDDLIRHLDTAAARILTVTVSLSRDPLYTRAAALDDLTVAADALERARRGRADR